MATPGIAPKGRSPRRRGFVDVHKTPSPSNLLSLKKMVTALRTRSQWNLRRSTPFPKGSPWPGSCSLGVDSLHAPEPRGITRGLADKESRERRTIHSARGHGLAPDGSRSFCLPFWLPPRSHVAQTDTPVASDDL